MIRTLGIDPGSQKTGWAVIDHQGQRLIWIASGVIRLGSGPFPERMATLGLALREIVVLHQPMQMAIEEVFLAKDPQSALKLGHARGVAMFIGAEAQLPVFEYAARRVKQVVVGQGQADKRQMQTMVKLLLGLSQSLPEDASDAAGVAICHAHSSSGLAGIGTTTSQSHRRRSQVGRWRLKDDAS